MSTKRLTERFGQSGLDGGKAEDYSYPLLQKAYDEVIDLREDPEAQYRGIDFGIKQAKWKHPYYLDVKGNLHNGMFYLEFRKADGRPGWFHTSTSHRIYHVDVEEEKVAWYDLHKMRMRLLDMGVMLDEKSLLRLSNTDSLVYDLIRTNW